MNDEALTTIKKGLCDFGAMFTVIAPRHGFVKTTSGDEYPSNDSLLTAASVVLQYCEIFAALEPNFHYQINVKILY